MRGEKLSVNLRRIREEVLSGWGRSDAKMDLTRDCARVILVADDERSRSLKFYKWSTETLKP